MLTELRMRATICSDPLGLLALMVGCDRGVARAGFAGNVRGGRIVWAGHVDDDRRGIDVFLLGDGGGGTEEVGGDIGEGGGTAGGGVFLLGGGGGGGGGDAVLRG